MTPCEHCAAAALDAFEAVEGFPEWKSAPFFVHVDCPGCGADWARVSHRAFSQTYYGEMTWDPARGFVTGKERWGL